MKKIIYGIQGGKGSFNEEALIYYARKEGIKEYDTNYLYTSENVMIALERKQIDRGQFAIHNSAGGMVEESLQAMASHKFMISGQFSIKISHALMIRPDADLSEIDTIMTHPQVLSQCRRSLAGKYPHLKQTSGEGELIDHALAAKNLAAGKLPKNIAIMGSKAISRIYRLKIIEDNLQDLKENYTTFLQVARNL